MWPIKYILFFILCVSWCTDITALPSVSLLAIFFFLLTIILDRKKQHLKIELTGSAVLVFKIWINSLSVPEIVSNIEAICISVSAVLSWLLRTESEVTRGAEQDLEVCTEVVLRGVIDCSGLECEVPGCASESGWLRNSSEIDFILLKTAPMSKFRIQTQTKHNVAG